MVKNNRLFLGVGLVVVLFGFVIPWAVSSDSDTLTVLGFLGAFTAFYYLGKAIEKRGGI